MRHTSLGLLTHRIGWLVVALLLLGAACGRSRLPPVATRAAAAPSASPTGGSLGQFFTLDLSPSDEELFTKRAEQIYQDLITSNGEVDRNVLIDAYRQLAEYPRVGGAWQRYGPAPVDGMNLPQGAIRASGRVNGIAVDPRDPNVIYLAASIGGLWKTSDGGQTWRSLTDRQVPLVYGGLVMDPRDPNTLYALLGEFDASAVGRVYGYLANGIMRSRDAGATWQLVAPTRSRGQPSQRSCSAQTARSTRPAARFASTRRRPASPISASSGRRMAVIAGPGWQPVPTSPCAIRRSSRSRPASRLSPAAS